MGARTFYTIGTGINAKSAFDKAVEHAKYEHGHGGYSGTIAEKTYFIVLSKPASMALQDYLSATGYNAVYDKWGPAGCVELVDKEAEKYKTSDPKLRVFCFFGWASS
jgi:hypothetical protein